MTLEEIPELIAFCRHNMCTPDGRRVCFLCGSIPERGESAVIGLFMPLPEHQRRFGAPANKTRLMIYLLCEECFTRPDAQERVEDKIVAEMSVQ